MKGPVIDVGDRVLLVNKKERGKRKVADRWESTVYTVMERNSATHTYRICDTVTGQEKVVHHNLLMLVNFLPVDIASVISDPASSSSVVQTLNSNDDAVSEVERGSLPDEVSREMGNGTSVHERGRADSLSVPESVDPGGRTLEWITQQPFTGHSHVNSADTERMAPVPLATQSKPEETTENRMEDRSIDSDSSSVTDTDVSGSSNTGQTSALVTQTDDTSDTQCTVAVALTTQSKPLSTLTQFKSGFGRPVKPVTRLICEMSGQKVIHDMQSNVVFFFHMCLITYRSGYVCFVEMLISFCRLMVHSVNGSCGVYKASHRQ